MRAVIGAIALLVAQPALAVLPSEQLPDAALEARARTISAQLRCVVCQNQSIDDSDAPLAHDLRVIVRERLSAGASDQATIQYLVDRYGSYVLLKPPFEPATWALWLAPFGAVAAGAIATTSFLRSRRKIAPPPPLDAREAEQVAGLLNRDLP